MPGIFVTGTDTGVGKTQIAAALVHLLAQQGYRTAGLKPVASGCRRTADGLRNDDALALMAVSNVELPYTTVNPVALEPATAPHLAAGGEIALSPLVTACQVAADRVDWTVVEGVGGWMVPLGCGRTMADLAVALNYPVVLVVGLRLGCLSHALLSAAAIKASGAPLRGWVGVHLTTDFMLAQETLASLAEYLPVPELGVVPYLSSLEPAEVAQHLDLDAILSAI